MCCRFAKQRPHRQWDNVPGCLWRCTSLFVRLRSRVWALGQTALLSSGTALITVVIVFVADPTDKLCLCSTSYTYNVVVIVYDMCGNNYRHPNYHENTQYTPTHQVWGKCYWMLSLVFKHSTGISGCSKCFNTSIWYQKIYKNLTSKGWPCYVIQLAVFYDNFLFKLVVFRENII